MFEILKAVLFGVVEGITEWLPVSSTGHMILLDEFVKMNVSPEFWDTFLVVIQLGAILAVVLLYWGEIWPLKRVIVEGKHATNPQKAIRLDKGVLNLWGKTIVACLPAAVIGLFQVIAAVFPGTSRSGATILGGLMIGVSRPAAANFTFILAIPVMAGASLLKLLKNGLLYTSTEYVILAVGMIVAFVVSLVCIRFLMGFVRKHDFKPFGWYRIVLGVLVIAWFGITALL